MTLPPPPDCCRCFSCICLMWAAQFGMPPPGWTDAAIARNPCAHVANDNEKGPSS